MVAELRSTSPKGRGEPPIPVGEVDIRGLAIDGFRMRVVLDTTAFNDHDTHAKLLRGAVTPAFVKKFGDQFFMKERVAGFPPPGPGRLIPHRRLIHATLVKRVEWESGANPRARIVGNRSVIVENFGKIFFGEILISAGSRRVTLMRLELGSDGGGQAGGPDVDTNGTYSP
jgi:hypothetical protein